MQLAAGFRTKQTADVADTVAFLAALTRHITAAATAAAAQPVTLSAPAVVDVRPVRRWPIGL